MTITENAPVISEPRRVCLDCGVLIGSGKRCTMHARIHTERAYWTGTKNGARILKCSNPGWLEEILAWDLARGMTVNEISKHRGMPVGMISNVLINLRQWLLTQPADSVNTYSGLVIAKAIEDFNFRAI